MTASATGATRAAGDVLIGRLVAIAEAAESNAIADEARHELLRIREGRFYVACLGQFKRGKSSLLNALIEDSLLPVAVVPATSVVTVLRFGPERAARVRIEGGEWVEIAPTALADYVTEAANPGNVKRVAGIEVFLPAPLLESGLCLVDTPGVGSVFASGTAATHAFVPRLDAALVVLGVDPPISGEEAALVQAVAREVDHVLFVLNKADRHSEAERRDAIAFTRQVLEERLGKSTGPILEVSAAERLAGLGATRDWPRLADMLTELADGAGATLVRRAANRAAGMLGRRLLRDLLEQRAALERPLDVSEVRIAALHRTLADAEQSLADLTYQFTREQVRLSQQFAAQQARFIEQATAAASEQVRTSLRSSPERISRARAHEIGTEIARRLLDAWWREALPAAEAAYGEAMERLVRSSTELLCRLADSDDPLLASLPRTLDLDLGFRTPSRFFFQMQWSSVPPWVQLFDLMRPREATLRAIEQDVIGDLADYLRRHSTRMVNDLDELVVESRRRLESEIRRHLRLLADSADRALERARARHAEGAVAVRHELQRLARLQGEVEQLVAASAAPDRISPEH